MRKHIIKYIFLSLLMLCLVSTYSYALIPEREVLIKDVRGNVRLIKNGGDKFFKVRTYMELSEDTTIITKDKESYKIEINDKFYMIVNGNSKVYVKLLKIDKDDTDIVLVLESGEIFVNIKKELEGASGLLIQTPYFDMDYKIGKSVINSSYRGTDFSLLTGRAIVNDKNSNIFSKEIKPIYIVDKKMIVSYVTRNEDKDPFQTGVFRLKEASKFLLDRLYNSLGEKVSIEISEIDDKIEELVNNARNRYKNEEKKKEEERMRYGKLVEVEEEIEDVEDKEVVYNVIESRTNEFARIEEEYNEKVEKLNSLEKMRKNYLALSSGSKTQEDIDKEKDEEDDEDEDDDDDDEENDYDRDKYDYFNNGYGYKIRYEYLDIYKEDKKIATFEFDSKLYSVSGDGKSLYLACHSNGVIQVDIKGEDLVNARQYEEEYNVQGVYHDGYYLYLATYRNGMRVYKVTDDGLDFKDYVKDADKYKDVSGDEKYIYTANYSQGIRAYKYSGGSIRLLAEEDDIGSISKIYKKGKYIYALKSNGVKKMFTFDGIEFKKK